MVEFEPKIIIKGGIWSHNFYQWGVFDHIIYNEGQNLIRQLVSKEEFDHVIFIKGSYLYT